MSSNRMREYMQNRKAAQQRYTKALAHYDKTVGRKGYVETDEDMAAFREVSAARKALGSWSSTHARYRKSNPDLTPKGLRELQKGRSMNPRKLRAAIKEEKRQAKLHKKMWGF